MNEYPPQPEQQDKFAEVKQWLKNLVEAGNTNFSVEDDIDFNEVGDDIWEITNKLKEGGFNEVSSVGEVEKEFEELKDSHGKYSYIEHLIIQFILNKVNILIFKRKKTENLTEEEINDNVNKAQSWLKEKLDNGDYPKHLALVKDFNFNNVRQEIWLSLAGFIAGKFSGKGFTEFAEDQIVFKSRGYKPTEEERAIVSLIGNQIIDSQ